MASISRNVDQSVAPSTGGGGGLIPVGEHEFEIRVSDVKSNSKGTGEIAAFEVFHTGRDMPDLKDKRVFVNINLTHTSAQAQAIGQGEFSALKAAIGHEGDVEDTEQLHYKPFYARVKHEQAKNWKKGGELMFKDNGDPLMNAVISAFLFEGCDDKPAANDPPANKPAPQTQQQAAPAPAAGATRTWRSKTA